MCACACTRVQVSGCAEESLCNMDDLVFPIMQIVLGYQDFTWHFPTKNNGSPGLLLDHEVDRSSFWLHGDEIFNELLRLDLTAGVCGLGVYPQDFGRVVIRQGLDNVYAVL